MAKKTTKKIETAENTIINNDTAVVNNEGINNVESSAENASNEQSAQQSEPITLESSKTTLSKRPWHLGAVKMATKAEDGTTRDIWVAAVIDANGGAVCCGDTVDMEFIIKLENSYDAILNLMNSSGRSLAEAVEVLQDFECKKSKFFSFN